MSSDRKNARWMLAYKGARAMGFTLWNLNYTRQAALLEIAEHRLKTLKDEQIKELADEWMEER